MDNMQMILQAIGSVGFPIVACCGMFYLYNNVMSKITTTLEKLDSTLDKVFDAVTHKEKEV